MTLLLSSSPVVMAGLRTSMSGFHLVIFVCDALFFFRHAVALVTSTEDDYYFRFVKRYPVLRNVSAVDGERGVFLHLVESLFLYE